MTTEARQRIEHILGLIRKPGLTIDENTPLVSSGLIDSMALVDLLLKLEDLTHTRLPSARGNCGSRNGTPDTASRVSTEKSYCSGFAGVPGLTPECFLACAIKSRTLSLEIGRATRLNSSHLGIS